MALDGEIGIARQFPDQEPPLLDDSAINAPELDREQGGTTLLSGCQGIIEMLNDSLATELVCVLRYKRHYFMASGIHAQPVAAEFLEHANEEQGHADQIAERITQLGGAPDFNPQGLATRSHAEYVEGNSLIEMLQEDLVAERVAIESYGEMVRYIGTDDPTTRRMLEGILAVEEEHAEDLKTLLETLPHEIHTPPHKA